MIRQLLTVAAAAALLAGCAAEEAPTVDELAGESSLDDGGKADGIADNFTFFAVAQDTRKCSWPLCGGYWVSRVNRAYTRCADGSWQDRCYVASADFAATGLSASQVDRARSELGTGRLLVRGGFEIYSEPDFPGLARLVITEAWQGGSDNAAEGLFVRVTDSGVRCITEPCLPAFREAKLNSVLDAELDELYLDGLGVNDEAITAAFDAAYSADGVLIAGYRYWFYEQGWRKGRYATQFFTRIAPEVVATDCAVGGCSGQLCYDPATGGGISTCEWRDEYACYATATCERQPDGACGWTPTPELDACIAAAQTP